MVETGFPGSPKKYVGKAPGCAGARPKTTGRPGWMCAPVKKNSAPRPAQDLLDQVVFAHADAAGEQQQVAGESLLHQMAQALDFVGCDRQYDRHAAGGLHLRGQRVAVGIADLVGGGLGGDVHEFVAGRKDRHPRTLVDKQLVAAA